ncbi:cytochrome P450 [Akkermansiaceae bacterium]|nr:cytochrome P450 [Akkermansiaceae bacterium]
MSGSLENDDVFRERRERAAVCPGRFQGETLPMILRHGDVMAAAKDWETFSSDVPFRVPIPSEENVRKVRQLPIETNPPVHTEYRAIVEPFFKKPGKPDFVAKISSLVGNMVAGALAGDGIEAVGDFAVPLQSRALAYLLGLPQSEAEEWIGWGTHVFRDVLEGESDGTAVDAYIARRLDLAAQDSSGDDFFSALAKAEFRGRKLTREEMAGFGNLTFAGGRDTVIHSITSVLAHMAEHPGKLDFLHADPKRIALAGEEFFRIVSPLTHIGRVCPVETDVHGMRVPADGRVSLCWASANRDAEVFAAPNEVRLDRKPNPHIAFGAGAHFCLGAAHARLIMRELLRHLSTSVKSITITGAVPNTDAAEDYSRNIGYERLEVRMEAR